MQLNSLSVLLLSVSVSVGFAAPAPANLDRQFQQDVRPFVTKYCAGCHSGKSPAAQLDLNTYTTKQSVTSDFPRWALVMERMEAKEMPPKPLPHPPAEATQKVIGWIHAVRTEEVRKSAGDPGPVLARRLSNSEYNYTIRDLTGQDLQPAREFPVDPANQAGFDNSGESLTMSPALLNKYLQAARSVADHLFLNSQGFDFAPWPMLVDTDRDKYAIKRIVDFYLRQPTDLADYFQAAWRYKHRAASGKSGATLAAIAADSKVSAKYLPVIWQLLEEPAAKAKEEVGPIAKLQGMWRALPGPKASPEEVRTKCVEMRNFVVRIRKDTGMQYAAPLVRGLPAGSQPLLNWKLRQFALHRRDSDPKALRNDTDPPMVAPTIPRYAGLHQEAAPRWAALVNKSRSENPDLVVPAAERAKYEASFARFASVFPDQFFVSERGRYFPDDSQDKGRLLSAGYHSVLGFYRDDVPLMELILDEKGQKELDHLWSEFEFISDFTARTWIQYFFNQSGEVQGKGAESGTARPTDHLVTDSEVVEKMRDAYLAKALADPKNDPIAPEAIRHHYDGINATLRGVEKARKAAEPKHLDALVRFAERAYRRPLTKTEKTDLLAFYAGVRKQSDLSHEDAIRDAVVSVLMAPDFLYRIDLLSSQQQPASSASSSFRNVAMKTPAGPKTSGGVAVQPLSPYALASRLSYFIWSSMPDEELLRHAAAGDLSKPDVLVSQVRRMLKDPRSRGLATEFAGNWLDFRHFETNNTVDRTRFPSFDAQLRDAMFQEPIRFIEDVIQNDRSVLDFIYAKHTFVNPSLAKHYGMPEVKGDASTWVRVDNADRYNRGGLLPMSVFLTQNSPGLRTSPVKRGYWVVRRVLGEIIPPPPPVVPELPQDESKTDLPLREVLAQHRSNALCAGCHARFDSFGLAFEGYGPVGEARTKDLAGRPVDIKANFPRGGEGMGVTGIREYIREHRQDDFVDNLSRKLLAYALNRSLQLSDEAVVDRMEKQAAAKEYTFNTLVETIVTSPQFLNKRSPQTRETSDPQSRRGD